MRLHSLMLRSEDSTFVQQAASSALSLRIEELESRIVSLAVPASRPEHATNSVRPINEMFEVLSARLDALQSRIDVRAVPMPKTADSLSTEVDAICVGEARWANHLIHSRSCQSTSSSVPPSDPRHENSTATAPVLNGDHAPKHLVENGSHQVGPVTADYPSPEVLKRYHIGQNLIHPTRGMGRVVQLNPNAEKFCTVKFHGHGLHCGEQHLYNHKSME